MSTKGKIGIVVSITLVVLVMVLPVSNFFLPRTILEAASGVPEFKPVSKIMQNKCVDCHSPGMTSYPIYGKLPGASQLIKADIDSAQQQIIFSKEHLIGQRQFNKLELARLQTVVENNDMPILSYKLLHWDAGLSAEDKTAFLRWIAREAKRPGANPTETNEQPSN